MFKRLEAPILYVSDVRKAVEFYVKFFGFAVLDDDGDFVMMSLGDSKVALNKADAEDKVAGHQTIILASDSIDEDYEAISSVDVHVDLTLCDPGYGRTFIIRDRDGNKIEVIE
ncbi:MAG: VOC family protein [Deltaproteobacteria bacterium]|nr:VOC family protein [Deltaproteobacteria bacterium]